MVLKKFRLKLLIFFYLLIYESISFGDNRCLQPSKQQNLRMEQQKASKQILDDIIIGQDSTTSIILISNKILEIEKMHLQVSPDMVTTAFMESTYKVFIQANSKPLFIVDAQNEMIKDLITTIRIYSASDPILIFTEMAPTGIGYNLYFIVVNSNVAFSIYEICAFCNEGRDEIRLINTRSTIKGFEKPLSFPPSYKGNMNGHTLKFSMRILPVVFFSSGRDEEGNRLWGGWESDMINSFAQVMYFSYKILPAFTQSRVIRMILNGTADVGGGAMPVVASSHQGFIEYTPIISRNKDVIITDKPPRVQNSSLL